MAVAVVGRSVAACLFKRSAMSNILGHSDIGAPVIGRRCIAALIVAIANIGAILYCYAFDALNIFGSVNKLSCTSLGLTARVCTRPRRPCDSSTASPPSDCYCYCHPSWYLRPKTATIASRAKPPLALVACPQCGWCCNLCFALSSCRVRRASLILRPLFALPFVSWSLGGGQWSSLVAI